MYWAPGASHGPHQVMKEWADKYKGKFDDGWDKYRERTFARAKAKGWIPQNAQLTPRPASMASWDSIPEAEKPFQRRLMEVFAGFTEHADYNAGRVIDEIETARQAGQHADLLHLGRQRLLVRGPERHHQRAAGAERDSDQDLAAHRGAERTRRPRRARRPEDRQHVPRRMGVGGQHARTRAPNSMGAYFGGTRQPMAVVVAEAHQGRSDAAAAVPPRDRHRADDLRTDEDHAASRRQRIRAGSDRRRQHGLHVWRSPRRRGRGRPSSSTSWPAAASTTTAGSPAPRARASRGWAGCRKASRNGRPLTDKWELYNIDEDWSQANDLAATNPQKLEEMKALFLLESTKNKNLPIGGGMWSTAMFHPEDAPASSLTEWTFDGPMTRMPESAAPKLGKINSLVTMDVDVPANANGVLYALAGFSGGVTCYVKDGFLSYEFNLFEVQRTKIKSKDKLPTGKVKIEVESKLAAKIGGPMDVTLKVNGEVVAQGQVPAAMSLHFTSNATFDIGTDLDSPVSLDYFDQAPFAFNGTIGTTKIVVSRRNRLDRTARPPQTARAHRQPDALQSRILIMKLHALARERLASDSDVARDAAAPDDGSVLPFPPTPSASVAGPTLQESDDEVADGAASGSSRARRTSSSC